MTQKRTAWLYDAMAVEHRSANGDERTERNISVGQPANSEFQLKTSDGNLLAVNRESNSSITLVRSQAEREVYFRGPVWSPDGSKVLFVGADYTDIMKRWVLVPSDPSYPGG